MPAFGKAPQLNHEQIREKSDCIVVGRVVEKIPIRVSGVPLVPRPIEVVRIEVVKKIKSTSLGCSAIRDKVDVIAPAPLDTEIERCESPVMSKAETTFLLDTTSRIPLPASCWFWFF